MREGQLGGHKNSYIVNNTSLLVNETNDFSSIPATPSTYTVDYAPSSYTVDNTLSTYTVENAPHTCTVDSASGTYTVDNTKSTYTVDNAPCTYTVTNAQNIYIADNTPSNSSTDHAPSTSTTDNALPSTSDSVPDPSSTNYVPNTSTSDSTPRPSPIDSTPSSSISDHAPNTPISESAPSTSTSHGKKWSAAGSGSIKQKPGGKQSKSPSSNAAEKGKVRSLILLITTIRNSAHRTMSEVVSFTTPGCEPDPPLAPKLINRSKSSLNLQWKGSNDNGSKINSFLLEWDEGKGEGFKSCYMGTMKQHKILKLNASTKYSFRLAAKNNFGLSDFSEIAVFHTSGTMPPTPSPPKLKEAGICDLSLEWCAPTNTNPNDSLTYVLEMEEGLGFKPKYHGEDLSCTIRNLQRSTTYKCRIFAYNLEGRSNPSGEVKYTTCPDKPGSPKTPYIKGKIYAHRVKIGWEPPKDNGGTYISSYSLEVSENSDENSWNIIYNGTTKEFLYDHLQPGTTYKLRVFCTSPIGQSQPSDILTIQTPTLAPASCHPPPLNGEAKTRETNIKYDNHPNGNSEALADVKKAEDNQDDKQGRPSSKVRCILTGVGLFGETGTVTTPATVPAVVLMLHEVENKVPPKLASSCIAIQWEEPDCHGSPITGYNIEYGDRKIITVERVTECLLKNLQPDTTYNTDYHYGLSPFSQSIRTKTKPLPPDPPHLDCVVYGHQSLKLKWCSSSSKGVLSNPISYNLLIGNQSGRFSIIYHGPCQTHKVHRLSEYTQYKFKIQACNEAGEGPLSGIYTFTTSKTPPATLKAPKLQHVNSNICEIKWESLEPIKGDPIVYNLQLISQKGTDLIYQGPNTSFSFSNFVTNSHYRFKVCAGRQYQNSAGIQEELWGPYSPSVLFSTHKQHPGPGKGGGGKGGRFALVALLCAVTIQHFLIN
uniref:Fibronectin type III domain containing protein 3C1-like n=1 Tax=Ursus maritimus TaxID=29073 RepID=A0A452V1A6_URSMA